MKISELSFRQISAAAAVASLGLLAYGYYLQYFDAQDPCPLCIVQRLFFFGVMIVLGAAALHGPARAGRVAYSIVAFILALGGLATATRQVWLQHLPADQVPACGPSLDYMVRNYPFSRMLHLLLRGSGQCAEVHWRFLGLSIAEWSWLWFAGFAALALALALRNWGQAPNSAARN